MSDEIDLDRIVERVQKILALGRRAGTEGEMAAATAKAQEMLTKYNLDLATVDKAQVGAAAREKANIDGGMYIYQRELWRAIAQLNFCLCFHTQVLADARGGKKRRVWRNQMMVVGRKVNTRATIAMGSYLEQSISRLCVERLTAQASDYRGGYRSSVGDQINSSWAVAFREGCADRAIEKINERRDTTLKAENKKKAKAAKAGISTSTAISLQVYVDAETDANNDFMYGEGTSARWASQRAEAAADAVREDAEYTAWAEANPEEAAAEEKKQRSQRRSSGRTPSRKINSGGYWAGHEAGEKIGIDPQAEKQKVAGRIGRG